MRDEEIMRAQKHIHQTDQDFVLLTGICQTISLNPEFMNPNVGGHYNNAGMTLIGNISGSRLAEMR